MIEKSTFLNNFKELFDETSPDQITFQSHFRDLDEWSSLIVLSLIVQFEDNYNVKLSPEKIESAVTVEDLYQLTQ